MRWPARRESVTCARRAAASRASTRLGRSSPSAGPSYSVKPIDTQTLAAAAAATGGRIVVAEDHHPEGGLGSAVADALLASGQQNLHLTRLAVDGMPGSGTGEELLAWAGIDAEHIAAAARKLVGG